MTRPIRVCTVVNNFDVGGLEKVVLSLLNSLDPARFELSVACLKGEGKLFGDVPLPSDRRLVLSSDRPSRIGPVSVDVGSLRALRQFFRDQRADVVHVHNFAPLTYGGLAARSIPFGPKVVYSEHNQVNSASPADLRKFGIYVRLAHRVVAVSKNLQDILEEKLHVARPVEVILNGIDDRRFAEADGGRVRAELGIAPDEVVIGTAVVLSEQKGITYLIEAAKSVLERVPKARFVIAGDGPLRVQLEQQVAKAELGDRFRLVGYRRDIPDLLSSFDVYVLPSLWEGLPLALLEALRLGKPIVCTRVGGNAEVVEEGVQGWLVPPREPRALADRLIEVASDPGFRTRASASGQKRFFDHFSLASMTQAHELLYERLAG